MADSTQQQNEIAQEETIRAAASLDDKAVKEFMKRQQKKPVLKFPESPSDKLMSPATKQIEARRTKGLRPRLLEETLRKAANLNNGNNTTDK